MAPHDTQITSIEQSLKSGNVDQAKETLRAFIGENLQTADDASLLQRLAEYAYELRLFQGAISILIRANNIKADDPSLLNNLGNALMAVARYTEALACLERACEIDSMSEVYNYNLGLAYLNGGVFDKAEKMFEKVLSLNSRAAHAYAGVAAIAERLNNSEKALEMSRKALDIDPKHLDAGVIWSTVLRHKKNYDVALKRLNENLQLNPNHINSLFEKGHVLDGKGRYDEAYSIFCQANKLADPGVISKDVYLERIKKYIALYDEIGDSSVIPAKAGIQEALPSLDLFPFDSAQGVLTEEGRRQSKYPVFIVGSPRSGTTLLASMMGAHSQIYNAGELNCIFQLTGFMAQNLRQNISDIDCAKILWSEGQENLISMVKKQYGTLMHDHVSESKKARWIVDKQPLNAYHLAIIAKVLPGAPIIHIVRDGRDVALSAFMQNFRAYHWHSYSLENAICEWQECYRLVKKAADVFGLHLIEVRYEELVHNPHDVMKRVFEFLDVLWEEECLKFYKGKTFEKTASYLQVKKPLYQTAVSRSKNYSEAYQVMTKLAGPLLLGLGYG
jgi:tetratricopeptide (TPR) repeat protein